MSAHRSSKDPSQEALRAVQAITGTGKVRGEDLLGSPKLKRQLAAAKKAESLRKKIR